jgi:hypothetical protein
MILVFLTYIYVAYLSPEAIRGHTNYDNSQKIRPFMSKEEVISIMGIPDTMYHNVMRPGYPKSYDLIYTPPFGASDDVRIWIDSTDHVIEVLPMD